MTIATLVHGHTTGADVLFLIAFILFVVVAAIAIARNAVESALTPIGLALVSLAFLLL